MTPEAQRIAIAGACGHLNPRQAENGGFVASISQSSDGRYWGEHGIPDYLNDLNAMHEAWLELPPSKKDRFESELYQVVIGEAEYNRNDDDGWITNATAAQRAEAFLKAINLWEQ